MFYVYILNHKIYSIEQIKNLYKLSYKKVMFILVNTFKSLLQTPQTQINFN
jgi:hypothetical protein